MKARPPGPTAMQRPREARAAARALDKPYFGREKYGFGAARAARHRPEELAIS
jgi:hypothetical protein